MKTEGFVKTDTEEERTIRTILIFKHQNVSGSPNEDYSYTKEIACKFALVVSKIEKIRHFVPKFSLIRISYDTVQLYAYVLNAKS